MKKVFRILLIALSVFIGFIIYVNPIIKKYYMGKYYRENYKSEDMQTQTIGSYPSSFRINDIPHISNKKAYCQPTALQMISEKYGIREDIGYFNFLMGFSYGSFYRSDFEIFSFFEDPVQGFRSACPYLGLKMKCLTANDSAAFLNSARFYLSKGLPVIVELDAGTLWGETVFLPHSEVLIGYNEKGFEYFETGKEDSYKAAAMGIMLEDDVLVRSVARFTKEFMNPWKFMILVFEKSGKKTADLKEAWRKNGNLLIGKKGWLAASGSCAIELFAQKFKKSIKVRDISMLEPSVYTRADNALFLQKYFKRDKEAAPAAKSLAEASGLYRQVIELIKTGEEEKRGEVAGLLQKTALLERSTGEIFLKKTVDK